MNVLNEYELQPYIYESADVCVWEMSLKTHKITYLSPSIELISWLPSGALIQSPSLWLNLIYPEDIETVTKM
ncbi:hypothetical protein R4Z09_16165 [Niallia oryzisoli]|uniref:Uncharacterized protein n=1 Tax=Niallia oryzisoli TaxID=1737571 RepID=A0ABZ2C9E0_9BACI